MSYQVIARKYRPQSFADLIGQEHISQTLLNALKAKRFPHALLFTGTRGVGKTSTARILAKTLLCPHSKDLKPCHECQACLDITSGSHMDVIEIDGASNNGVDSIRELRETMSYMPSSGKYKVYIIDEVHMLSTSAFNALLKTLEEPPEHIIFILATTEPQKIPVTILSRCQRFDFRRISSRLIQSHLTKICSLEKVDAEPEALWSIARLSDGSMRDSLSLLDQAINFTDSHITLKKIEEVLGLTSRELLVETLKALTTKDLDKILKTITLLFSVGHDPLIFAQNLLEEIRHLLFTKVSTRSEKILDLSEGEIKELETIGQNLSLEDIHMLFDMCLKGLQDLSRSQNQQIVLEMLLMRMAQAPRIKELGFFLTNNSSPLAKNTKEEAFVPPSHSSLLQRTPINTPNTPSFDGKKSLLENWISITGFIKEKDPLLGAQLEPTALISYDKKTLTLGLSTDDQFLLDRLKSSQQIQKIKTYIHSLWGHQTEAVHVEVYRTNDLPTSPQKKSQEKIIQATQKTQDLVLNHPVIKNIQKNFKGKVSRIIEISEEGLKK